MKFILGTKLNMVQLFDDAGKVHPCTVVEVSPLTVTAVKAGKVQVGYGLRKAKNVSKAVRGSFKAINNLPEGKTFKLLKEFSGEGYNVGDTIDLTTFSEGDIVEVSGISKAKGFQGVVKRHGFHGGRRSHGQKHSEREPGSIGATAPQRVFKGLRMGGRMGGDRVTVKNLKVMKIDTDNNCIFISGAVPGRRGTLLEIKAK